MTATSIICTKKDVESVLGTLNSFGEFHIEPYSEDDANIAQYNANIQKAQERILDVDGLAKQLIHEKGSLLGMFKASEPKKVVVTADNWQSLLDSTNQDILTLKTEVDNLNGSLAALKEKKQELSHLKKILQSMEAADADPEAIGELKLIYVAFASMPIKNCEAFQMAIAGQPFFVKQSRLTDEECFLSVASSSKHQDEVERILRTYHAELFLMPPDLPCNVGEAHKEVAKQLKDNEDKEKNLRDQLGKIGGESKDQLASWRETSENILVLLTAERDILQTGRLATVKGFVPQKKFSQLQETVTRGMEGKVLVLQDEAQPDYLDHKVKAPSKFANNRFVKPFEEITKLYGLPNYNEVDPTPLMAITFPFLFGLMFGDLGHGLVLLLGGLIVGSLIKGNQGMKNMCWIIAACGVGAMVAGALFGEFFGQPVFEAIWFHPTENVAYFLIFALFVGIVQISIGIALELVDDVLKHDVIDAVLTALPKILFFAGGVFLVVTYQLDFGAWLSGPILLPLIPFIIMVAGKPIYMKVAKSAVTHESEHPESETLVGRFFEGGDFLTRLLSNTISYSRILALFMAHWALLLVTYTVAGLIALGVGGVGGLVLSAVIIVFGNVAVLALEGLIVFIHTLRLHFYEWFSKFYAGAGTEFKPFKQNYSHTELTLKQKKE
jgi:V/A-type H+/Na+-transporting ATPase subunit I